jgi:hypothetical protein
MDRILWIFHTVDCLLQPWPGVHAGARMTTYSAVALCNGGSAVRPGHE